MNPTPVPPGLQRRFNVKREVARGGTCLVYSAEHRMTGRTVALKFLRPECAADVACHRRLMLEARALELSRHQGVVEIIDADTSEGNPFLVLEMLEGRTLQGILAARSRLPLADAVAIVRQACDALNQAHSRGVIHRSLHPGHVLIARSAAGEEVVKLFDFSRACLGSETPAGGTSTSPEGLRGPTEYVAPEILLRSPVDHRSDLFSLGVLAVECLTGTAPQPQGRDDAVCTLAESATTLLREANLELPTGLPETIVRALATHPAQRYATAHAFGLALLETALEGFAPSSLLGARPSQAPQSIANQYISRFVPTFPPPSKPAPPLPEQRRKTTRQPYVTPVRLQLAGGEVVDGHSEDISDGGLLLIATRSFPSGGRGEVRIATPMTGKVARLVVQVRWVREGSDRVAAGLEFVDLPESTRAEIVEYVRLMDRSSDKSDSQAPGT